MKLIPQRLLDFIARRAPNLADLLKHAGNYFGANIAVVGLGVVSMPVMTRLLMPSDYGVTGVFAAYAALFGVILTGNVASSIGRFYLEQPKEYREFTGTCVIIILTLVGVSAVCFFLFSDQLSRWLSVPRSVVALIPVVVLFQVSGSIFEQIFQARKESRKIAVRKVAEAFLRFGAGVCLVLLVHADKYRGYIWAQVVVGFGFFVYYIIQLKPFISFTFRLSAFRYVLAFSLPLIPYALSGTIIAQFDRIIISRVYGDTTTGLFNFAVNIGLILTLVYSALFQAWAPEYIKLMKEGQDKRISRTTYQIMSVMFVAAVFLVLFGQEVGKLLGSRSFQGALGVVPIVVAGNVFNGIFYVYGYAATYVKKTAYLSATVICASVLSVVLNVILIPRYGYIMGAVDTAISYVIMVVLAYIVNRFILNCYCVPVRPVLLRLALAGAFIGLAYATRLPQTPGFLSLLGRIGIFFACTGALVALELVVKSRRGNSGDAAAREES